jgi:hypothetical protein
MQSALSQARELEARAQSFRTLNLSFLDTRYWTRLSYFPLYYTHCYRPHTYEGPVIFYHSHLRGSPDNENVPLKVLT